MSKDRNRMLFRQKFLALYPKIYISHNLDKSKEKVTQLQGRCNELWHHHEPTQKTRAEGCCGGCKWQKISLDLLPSGVEEWVLVTPSYMKRWSRVRLLQRVTACLSILTVQTVLHVLGIPRTVTKVPVFLWRNQRLRNFNGGHQKTHEKSDFLTTALECKLLAPCTTFSTRACAHDAAASCGRMPRRNNMPVPTRCNGRQTILDPTQQKARHSK